jgi:signal transduction histidine kinase
MLRPFVRGRSAETGAGLGLALTQELVRLHGGALRLRDAEAGGLKAVVRLPRSGPR